MKASHQSSVREELPQIFMKTPHIHQDAAIADGALFFSRHPSVSGAMTSACPRVRTATTGTLTQDSLMRFLLVVRPK